MIRLKITMNSGSIVTRDCQDQQEADEYLTYISTNGNWGKPNRWVREGQEDISNAIENKIVIDKVHVPAIIDAEGNVVTSEIPEISHAEYHLASEYTVDQTDVTSEYEEQVRKDALKAAGAKARIACQTVLDLISGHNLSSELTGAQITSMTQTFGPLVQALTISRPSTAKILIQAIVPDGILITEQMKQDCLDELKDY